MKHFCTLLLVSGTMQVFSQSITPQVVASSGEYFTGSAASLSWTLGEVATDTYIGSSNQLTQGFQQPEIRFSTVEDNAPEIVLSLYPNPTNSLVNLEASSVHENLQITVQDMTGKLIYTGYYIPGEVHKIDLSECADGLYLLKVSDSENTILKTYKIQKS